MNQSRPSNFGVNAQQVWAAIITGHYIITEPIDQNHPIWGASPNDDPSKGCVYAWESIDGLMEMPAGMLVGAATPALPFGYDCKNLFQPTQRYAVNLARGDSRLRYPRIPIGTPTLMWMGRPPKLLDPLADCNPLLQPVLSRNPPPWICFMEYAEPLSTYCDCDNGWPDLSGYPPCPVYA